MAYERPSLEVARLRYSVTSETVDDLGNPFARPHGAVRRNGEIVAYFGGWGPDSSALICARENAEKRARLDAGIFDEPEVMTSPLFKGPEDY